jgi:hypothetical protein
MNATNVYLIAGIILMLGCVATQSHAADTSEEQLKAWRKAIAQTPVPFPNACFHASYPDTAWTQVECVIDPNPLPFGHLPRAMTGNGSERIPRSAAGMQQYRDAKIQTVGGSSSDWMAQGSGLPSSSIVRDEGIFTTVSGVTSETDGGATNEYSVQLNTNTFSTPSCVGASCLGFQQFVYYSSSSGYITIQFWLEDYGAASCPAGWNTLYGGFTISCYMDGPHIYVPQLAASSLNTLDMLVFSGASAFPANMTLTVGSNAYYTYDSGVDTLDLTPGWYQSEFNVFGGPGHPTASFNTGSSITIYNSIGATNSSDSCVNQTQTGEMNNLALTTCATGHPPGDFPYITFTESN